MEYEFIYINAKKYKDDTSFMRNLLEILQEELDQELLDDDEQIDSLKKTIFKKYFSNTKVILYIDKAEVLSKKMKQTFIYSFFDDLKCYKYKPFMILATSDLFFYERLEKRVKSRFTFNAFYFDVAVNHVKLYFKNLAKLFESNSLIQNLLLDKEVIEEFKEIYQMTSSFIWI